MTKSKNVNCERIDIYACMYALTSTCSWNKMSSVSNDLTCTTPTFKKHVHLPLSLQSCRITGFFSTAARRNTSSTCLRRQKILFVNPTLQSVNAPFPWRIWRVPSQCTPEFPRIEGLIRFNLNTRPYGFISGGGGRGGAVGGLPLWNSHDLSQQETHQLWSWHFPAIHVTAGQEGTIPYNSQTPLSSITNSG